MKIIFLLKIMVAVRWDFGPVEHAAVDHAAVDRGIWRLGAPEGLVQGPKYLIL